MSTVNFYHFLPCFCLLLPLYASAAVLYVDLNSPGPAAPFTTWATAATKIQDAIDAAVIGDVIMATNGVYATGGRAVYGTMTNRVAVTKPVHLLSVNGPQFTVIQGYQIPGTTNGDGAIRCVYLTNGASLSGFMLTNGATRIDSLPAEEDGGGVWCESTNALVIDCLIIGNSARSGGGAYSGTLRRCELRNNTASGYNGTYPGGGGAASANLDRCTIINNYAHSGGSGGGILLGTANCSLIVSNSPNGASWGILNNCVVARNLGDGVFAGVQNNCTVVGNSGFGAIGSRSPGAYELCVLNNCIVYDNSRGNYTRDNFSYYAMSNTCTYPELPQDWQQWPGAANNITNAPGFMDLAAGDYHLRPSSPCINAGTNRYVLGEFDLDGNARIVGPRVDMGAYEFPSTQPALQIVPAGINVLLAWPLWASDFELQQTTVLPPSPTDWHSSGVSPITTEGQNEVLLPVGTAPKLFRLFKPQLP